MKRQRQKYTDDNEANDNEDDDNGNKTRAKCRRNDEINEHAIQIKSSKWHTMVNFEVKANENITSNTCTRTSTRISFSIFHVFCLPSEIFHDSRARTHFSFVISFFLHSLFDSFVWYLHRWAAIQVNREKETINTVLVRFPFLDKSLIKGDEKNNRKEKRREEAKVKSPRFNRWQRKRKSVACKKKTKREKGEQKSLKPKW